MRGENERERARAKQEESRSEYGRGPLVTAALSLRMMVATVKASTGSVDVDNDDE